MQSFKTVLTGCLLSCALHVLQAQPVSSSQPLPAGTAPPSTPVLRKATNAAPAEASGKQSLPKSSTVESGGAMSPEMEKMAREMLRSVQVDRESYYRAQAEAQDRAKAQQKAETDAETQAREAAKRQMESEARRIAGEREAAADKAKAAPAEPILKTQTEAERLEEIKRIEAEILRAKQTRDQTGAGAGAGTAGTPAAVGAKTSGVPARSAAPAATAAPPPPQLPAQTVPTPPTEPPPRATAPPTLSQPASPPPPSPAPSAQPQQNLTPEQEQKLRELLDRQLSNTKPGSAEQPAPPAAATPMAVPATTMPPAGGAVSLETGAPPLVEPQVDSKAAREARAREEKQRKAQAKAERERLEREKAEREKLQKQQAKAERNRAKADKDRHEQLSKAAEFVEVPDLPISPAKQRRLADLLDAYMKDQITPAQYHLERAKIIAER